MADNFAVSEQLDPKLQPERLEEAMVNAVESGSDKEERTFSAVNWLIIEIKENSNPVFQQVPRAFR